LTLALDGGEWSASSPGKESPGTHQIGGWGPRTSLDAVKRPAGIWIPILPYHYMVSQSTRPWLETPLSLSCDGNVACWQDSPKLWSCIQVYVFNPVLHF